MRYENDGFISYSLHFTDADNDMKINKYKSDYGETGVEFWESLKSCIPTGSAERAAENQPDSIALRSIPSG